VRRDHLYRIEGGVSEGIASIGYRGEGDNLYRLAGEGVASTG